MRDLDPEKEQHFFSLFKDYFDTEKDAGKQHDPANYTLDRMFPLAALAGNPQDKLKIIHIAGTKGKGSTSHFVSELIQASGHSVGLFTSPHLDTVRERFELNNQLVDYIALENVAISFLESLRQTELHPSLFEIFTILALKLFADAGLEYAVLETGIGGRVDSTNFIARPLCTAITPVSFDHMALLGNTIEEIAAEKAGIIKSGVPIVLSQQPYEAAERVIRQRALELSSHVISPIEHSELPYMDTFPPFQPFFIKENFRTAATVVAQLGLTPSPRAFHYPLLRARCELIRREPLVISDAAHNGDSMEKLVAALNEMFPSTPFTVILGVVAGKDVNRICQALSHLRNSRFILTNPDTGKGSALPALQQASVKAGLDVIATIASITSIEQLPHDCPLLFTGSFFTALIAEKIL